MADSEGAMAPAEPASATPPPATCRTGRFAVAGSVVVSAVIHLVLVAPALLISSRLLQSGPAPSVTVDLVTPEELAAMTEKPTEKPTEPDKPKQPSPVPQQAPAAPPQSQAPIAALASAADAFATPFLPPQPSAPDPAPAQTAPLTQLLGVPLPDDKNGGVADERADLTAEEIAAFAAHVQSCWVAPPGLAKDVYAVLRVSLRRDGSLMTEPSLQGGSASKAAMALAVADGAKRALRKCTPYGGLPVAKYDEWRVLDLRFTPRGISTASTVSSGPRTPSG
jgi:hypothetical protein